MASAPITTTNSNASDLQLASLHTDIDVSNSDASSKDDQQNEENPSPHNTASIKALTEGHTSLKSNLEEARSVLTGKTRYLKELGDNVAHQRERNWMLEEKIRSLSERESQLKRKVVAKEKRQENLLSEVFDANWKLQEAKQYLMKLQKDQTEMRKKQSLYEQQTVGAESGNIKQLYEDVQLLQSHKTKLAKGDPEFLAIQNGLKMLEIEQRKKALHDAFTEREGRSEAMYLEIDELKERIKEKTKRLEALKKERDSKVWQLENQVRCLAETELRLQRTLDYMKARTDHGMNVPAPAPWPNFKEQ